MALARARARVSRPEEATGPAVWSLVRDSVKGVPPHSPPGVVRYPRHVEPGEEDQGAESREAALLRSHKGTRE